MLHNVNENLSPAGMADLINAIDGTPVNGVFWQGRTLCVYGRFGFNAYAATRRFVGVFLEWAMANGFQILGIGTDSLVGSAFVIQLRPRAIQFVPDGATRVFTPEEFDGWAELAGEEFGRLWKVWEPEWQREDDANLAPYRKAAKDRPAEPSEN